MIAGGDVGQDAGILQGKPPAKNMIRRRRPQPEARERRPQFGRGVVKACRRELPGQRVHAAAGDGVEIAADDDVGRVVGDVVDDGRELRLAQRARGRGHLDVGRIGQHVGVAHVDDRPRRRALLAGQGMQAG